MALYIVNIIFKKMWLHERNHYISPMMSKIPHTKKSILSLIFLTLLLFEDLAASSNELSIFMQKRDGWRDRLVIVRARSTEYKKLYISSHTHN